LHSQGIRAGETNREHILNLIEEFGIAREDKDKETFFEEIIRVIPTVSQVGFNRLEANMANMYLLDLFYRHFHLMEDNTADKLIGIVTYKKNEQLTRPMRLLNLIEAYSDNKINTLYNLSITEFLELNIHEINLLLESAGDRLEQQSAKIQEILDENNMEDIL